MGSFLVTLTSAGPPLLGLLLVCAIRWRFGATLETDWFFSIVVVSTATASFVNYAFSVSQVSRASQAIQSGTAVAVIWLGFQLNGLILLTPAALGFGWYYTGAAYVVWAVSASTLAVLHLQLLRLIEGKLLRSVLAGYVWSMALAACIFIFNTGVSALALYVSSAALIAYVLLEFFLTSEPRFSSLDVSCLVCNKQTLAALLLISPLILLGSAEAAMASTFFAGWGLYGLLLGREGFAWCNQFSLCRVAVNSDDSVEEVGR